MRDICQKACWVEILLLKPIEKIKDGPCSCKNVTLVRTKVFAVATELKFTVNRTGHFAGGVVRAHLTAALRASRRDGSNSDTVRTFSFFRAQLDCHGLRYEAMVYMRLLCENDASRRGENMAGQELPVERRRFRSDIVIIRT